LCLLLGNAAAAFTDGGYQYVQTTNAYAPFDDWALAAQQEFGPTAEVVDWNTIKTQFGDSVDHLKSLFDGIGYTARMQGGGRGITWNGSQRWSGSRSYGIDRAEGIVPGGYLVHDQILNNWALLGSWPADRYLIVRIPVLDPCFESGSSATYMKVCVDDDGSIREFQSPAGKQQVTTAANYEGYALCSGTGANLKVHGHDSGQDDQGFGLSSVDQPGGVGTFPLNIVRNTTDGKFAITQVFSRDTSERVFTVVMTVKNLTGAPITGVKLARYFNGDIDGSAANDVYSRTLDTVWGTQGPTGNGLALFAKSSTSHTTRVERATNWDPNGLGSAEKCDVTGYNGTAIGDYVGRVTYSLGTINAGASKTVSIVYRRL
jgi:hypothetical protein